MLQVDSDWRDGGGYVVAYMAAVMKLVRWWYMAGAMMMIRW